MPVAKVHTAAEAKEKQRVLKAGGAVKDGGFNGTLRVGRILGHAVAKKGDVIVATPDVISFEVSATQRFVVIGSEGGHVCHIWQVSVCMVAIYGK